MKELSNSEVNLVSGAGVVTANINSNPGIGVVIEQHPSNTIGVVIGLPSNAIGAIIHIPSFQEWVHNQLNGSEANINEFGINVNQMLR